MALWLAGGVQPSGFQSAAGMRMANAPIIIEQKYRAPMTTKVWTTPTAVGVLKCFIRATDMGEAMNAPPTATPARSADRRRETRSEEHTSELQSLMRISYAAFCLNKKHTT